MLRNRPSYFQMWLHQRDTSRHDCRGPSWWRNKLENEQLDHVWKLERNKENMFQRRYIQLLIINGCMCCNVRGRLRGISSKFAHEHIGNTSYFHADIPQCYTIFLQICGHIVFARSNEGETFSKEIESMWVVVEKELRNVSMGKSEKKLIGSEHAWTSLTGTSVFLLVVAKLHAEDSMITFLCLCEESRFSQVTIAPCTSMHHHRSQFTIENVEESAMNQMWTKQMLIFWVLLE